MKAFFLKYIRIVQLLVFVAGLFVLYVSTAITQNPFWANVLTSLGIAFVSSSTLTILQSSLGTDIPTLVEQRINFQRHVYDRGIEAVYLDLSEEAVFKQIENAKTIDMFYNTAQNATFRYGRRIADVIANKGCRVRILIADDENPIWSNIALINGLCPGTNVVAELKSVIAQVDLLMQQTRNQRPQSKKGSIEIRMYKCFPTCSTIIINDELARHTPYLPYMHSSEVPNFVVTSERDARLLAKYRQTFNSAWNNSDTRTVYKVDLAIDEPSQGIVIGKQKTDEKSSNAATLGS